METLVELRSAQKELDVLLAKKTLTAVEKKQTDILLSKVASLRDHQARVERAANLAKEAGVPVNSAEQRAANHDAAFRKYLRNGDAAELRTYTPMSTSNGGQVPEDFASSYTEKLKSFSGIRAAGAHVITTSTGHSIKNPIADDTSNVGERLAENAQTNLANPTFAKVTLGAYRYSSKGLLYSSQLLADSGIPVENYLSKIFARRISAIQEQEFTNGGSGAMAGVIPSITNVLTTAGATAVTVGEIVGLQALDNAYIPRAAYMMHPAILRVLRAMVNTDGLPTFPELRSGNVLCGFPVVPNTSMPSSLAANATAIIFGNFAQAVVIRDVIPSLLVSRERYAELNQLFAQMRHDSDCQVVLPDALVALQQHS